MAQQTPRIRIFVSYTIEEEGLIAPVVNDLRARGIEVYFFGDKYSPDNIFYKIPQEIYASSIFVVALSDLSFASTFVRFEVNVAHAYDVISIVGAFDIIPVAIAKYSLKNYDQAGLGFLKAKRHIEKRRDASFVYPKAASEIRDDLLSHIEFRGHEPRIEPKRPDGEVLVDLARDRFQVGKIAEASVLFEAAGKADSQSYDAWLGLASCQVTLGKIWNDPELIKYGIKSYHRALTCDNIASEPKKQMAAHVGKGDAAWHIGHEPVASRAYHDALALFVELKRGDLRYWAACAHHGIGKIHCHDGLFRPGVSSAQTIKKLETGFGSMKEALKLMPDGSSAEEAQLCRKILLDLAQMYYEAALKGYGRDMGGYPFELSSGFYEQLNERSPHDPEIVIPLCAVLHHIPGLDNRIITLLESLLQHENQATSEREAQERAAKERAAKEQEAQEQAAKEREAEEQAAQEGTDQA